MRKKIFAMGLAATGLMVLLSMVIGCGGGGGGNVVGATGEIIVRLVMTDAGKAVNPPDPRLTNWVVVLEASDEGQLREIATDDAGVVKFGQLLLNRFYIVTIREREGWTIVQPSEVLTLDAAHKTRDISVSVSRGAPEPEPTGEILVRLLATDAGQAVVAPDPRLKDWVVRIAKLDAGKGLTEQATDDSGSARFAEIELGHYAVSVQAKTGWTVDSLADDGATVLDDEHKNRTIEIAVNRPAPEPEPLVDAPKSVVQVLGRAANDFEPRGTADGEDFIWVYAEARGADGKLLHQTDIALWVCEGREGDIIEGGAATEISTPDNPDPSIGEWKVRTTTAGTATYAVKVKDMATGQVITLGSGTVTWEDP